MRHRVARLVGLQWADQVQLDVGIGSLQCRELLFRFLHANVFSNTSIGGSAVGFQSDTQRRNVEQFLFGFDTNLAPAVGQPGR